MNKIKVFQSIFIFLLLYCDSSIATKYLTCAQEFKPKFYSEGSNIKGYSVDIMKALKKAEPNLEFEMQNDFCTMPRIEADLLAGEQDVFIGAFKTEERKKNFIFIDIPIHTFNFVLVKRADDPIVIKSIHDLIHLKEDSVILTMFGTALEAYLKKYPSLVVDSGAPSLESNLSKLEQGRGRFLLTLDLGLKNEFKDPRWKNKFVQFPFSLNQESQYIMVSKNISEKKLHLLKSALAKIKTSGTLDEIFINHY